MTEPQLRFLFKIDTIAAAQSAPPQSFTNGCYKPPVECQDFITLFTTGWRRWSTEERSPPVISPSTLRNPYSTTIFYDDGTCRFLFHPADCRTTNIYTVERELGDKWGWRQLVFAQPDPYVNHSILDPAGEYNTLSGYPGSYSPEMLPCNYRLMGSNDVCALSGKMGLLLALTAFSCKPEFMLDAINMRLKLGERRWENYNNIDWGHGREHGRGFVVEICEDGDNTGLSAWENGEYGPLLR